MEQRQTREQRRRARRRTIRRRRIVVAAGALTLAIVALLLTVVLPSKPRPSRGRGAAPTTDHATRAGSGRPVRGPSAGPASFLGADGVESRAIIAENRRAGTTAWRIIGAPATGMIEGFADHNYVAAGESFGLYVSTTAPSFHVVAYRMGYYQGRGGWTPPAASCRRTSRCSPTPPSH